MPDQIPVSTVLTESKELIATEERWTKNSYAKTKEGRDIGPSSTRAVAFCSLGAIQRVLTNHGWFEIDADDRGNSYFFYSRCVNWMERAIAAVTDGKFTNVARYNDHIFVSHDHILHAFDEAIKMVKENEDETERNTAASEEFDPEP